MWVCCENDDSVDDVECLYREPTKTAHRQNGPNEGRKRPTQTKTAPTKTAPVEEKTRPKRPQLTSKTTHSHVQNGPLRNIVQISDKWYN